MKYPYITTFSLTFLLISACGDSTQGQKEPTVEKNEPHVSVIKTIKNLAASNGGAIYGNIPGTPYMFVSDHDGGSGIIVDLETAFVKNETRKSFLATCKQAYCVYGYSYYKGKFYWEKVDNGVYLEFYSSANKDKALAALRTIPRKKASKAKADAAYNYLANNVPSSRTQYHSQSSRVQGAGGLKKVVKNSGQNSYAALCKDGSYGSVYFTNGNVICASGNGKNSCKPRHTWSVNKAAEHICK